jgi:hypothetical protein
MVGRVVATKNNHLNRASVVVVVVDGDRNQMRSCAFQDSEPLL